MSQAVELNCDDYRFLLVAGPYRKDMPENVGKLMEEHERTCQCMNKKGYHQDLCGVGVTEPMETTAQNLIQDLDKQVTLSQKQ